MRAATRKHTPSSFVAPSDITLLPQLDGEIQPDAELAASTEAQLPLEETFGDLCSEDERPTDALGDPSSDEDPQAMATSREEEHASAAARSQFGLSLPCGNQGCSFHAIVPRRLMHGLGHPTNPLHVLAEPS